MKIITKSEKWINRLERKLTEEGRSRATKEKYLRDVKSFLDFAGGRISPEVLSNYKEHLKERNCANTTINAKLSAVRKLLPVIGREDIKIENMKIQRCAFVDEEKMLTRKEYRHLVETKMPCNSKRKRSTYDKTIMIMETIAATGIRVSELSNFTVAAVTKGVIVIYLKGKERRILIPSKLRKKLLKYAKASGIKEGAIFINGKGEPLHRSQIWQMMKSLCKKAGVDSRKVYPHALRKLFARAFYDMKKDIAKLADVLGHSSINTTRIYIATTSGEHRRIIDKLGFVT